jgi:flagellar assembly protein FliH
MTIATPPKDKQTAYERWEFASFSDPKPKSKKPEPSKEEQIISARIAQIYESVRKEAYTKGMQEGFAVGLDKAREYAEVERQSLIKLMRNFSDALEKSDEQIADDVLTLALDIAKAMLKTKINVDPTAVLPVVMDAIHYLPYVQKPARIIVHHEDAQILREYLADELESQHWLVQEDVNVERGGCLVETGANQIDATNEVRWKRIVEAFSKNNPWNAA